MKALTCSLAAMALLLQGCAVSVRGHESVVGAVRMTGTSTIVQSGGRAGGVGVNTSIVSPGSSASGQGVQAGVSGSGGLLVFLGLLSAGLDAFMSNPRETMRGPMPVERISETCSCYGYVPPAVESPPQVIDGAGRAP